MVEHGVKLSLLTILRLILSLAVSFQALIKFPLNEAVMTEIMVMISTAAWQ